MVFRQSSVLYVIVAISVTDKVHEKRIFLLSAKFVKVTSKYQFPKKDFILKNFLTYPCNSTKSEESKVSALEKF